MAAKNSMRALEEDCSAKLEAMNGNEALDSDFIEAKRKDSEKFMLH